VPDSWKATLAIVRAMSLGFPPVERKFKIAKLTAVAREDLWSQFFPNAESLESVFGLVSRQTG